MTRSTRSEGRASGRRRALAVALLSALALAAVPVVSAHGGGHAATPFGLAHTDGLLLALAGALLVAAAVVCKRTGRTSPTTALWVAFSGIAVAAAGAVLFDGLSPEPVYTAATIPFPRSWYPALGLGGGVTVAVVSFVVGWLRWPTRPRYTYLGILAGVWIAYPYLVPGGGGDTHPLGYLVVLATLGGVWYVVWRDAGDLLRSAGSDPVSRRFGAAVAAVVFAFFLAVTGYLSVFPEPTVTEPATEVLPAVYQIVAWPTLEIVRPDVPLFLALSPGQLLVVGTLSGLVGANAAVVARQWRTGAAAGLTEGTTGTAAVVGSCTCGCCGPLVAKVGVLAAGPATAAPLYWLFVDAASPLSAVVLLGALALFTGGLVRSAGWPPGE